MNFDLGTYSPDSSSLLYLFFLFFILSSEEETDHYSKLQCPQEDIYSDAFYSDTSEFKKAGKL